jgi:hypothetical protein
MNGLFIVDIPMDDSIATKIYQPESWRSVWILNNDVIEWLNSHGVFGENWLIETMPQVHNGIVSYKPVMMFDNDDLAMVFKLTWL